MNTQLFGPLQIIALALVLPWLAGCGETDVKKSTPPAKKVASTGGDKVAATDKDAKSKEPATPAKNGGARKVEVKEPATPAKEAPKPETKGPALALTAEAFATEFVKDAPAATKKYNGKIVQLEGSVFEVAGTDGVVLEGYKSATEKREIFCRTLPPAREKLATLKKGQKVKVTGKVVCGGGSALLEESTFVE